MASSVTASALASVCRGAAASCSRQRVLSGTRPSPAAAAIPRRSYTCAITRGIPNSFAASLSSQSDNASVVISVHKAKEEHTNYVKFLRSVLPTVYLPASDDLPDCPFVEDAAVVIGNRAVVTRIGAESRVGEADAIHTTLTQLGLDIVDMADEEGATVDGGDVLYPVTSRGGVGLQMDAGETGRGPTVSGGRHLFVGLSDRTNMAGVRVLERAFADRCEIIPVPIPSISESGALHLKSIVTHVNETTLLVPEGELGNGVFEAMNARERGYEAVRLPDIAACNVVVVNGIVMASPTECHESKAIFEREMEKRGLRIKYMTNIEFAKCDGALTCRSILLDI